MTAIFISDVHLFDGESVKSKLVIRFLQEVASRFEKIYILGDFFDVWPGTTNYLVKRFEPILDVLKSLVKDGHEVHYLEGNHDFCLGEYFSQELGLIVHDRFIEETWNGKRIYMEHGDLGNPKDLSYKALRRVLRSDLLHSVMDALPETFVYKAGDRWSKTSRKYKSRTPAKNAQIRQTYRKTAESIFAKGYDVVIMGHTHLPDDVTTHVGNRICRYINTGDWLAHFTYLEFDGNQFYTRTHPVKNL